MDDDRTEDQQPPEGPGHTPDDIKTKPPGNPPVDEQAVEEGKEKLDSVKPY
jgi:hypothetical protein